MKSRTQLAFSADATEAVETEFDDEGRPDLPETVKITWRADRPIIKGGFQLVIWEYGQITQGSMTPCRKVRAKRP